MASGVGDLLGGGLGVGGLSLASDLVAGTGDGLGDLVDGGLGGVGRQLLGDLCEGGSVDCGVNA